MKYKQNFKIMQITDKTLVIGVDIAKKTHFARAYDWRGIELDKTISFKANATFKNPVDNEPYPYGDMPVGHPPKPSAVCAGSEAMRA